MSTNFYGTAALCWLAAGTLSCSSGGAEPTGGSGECADSVVQPLSPEESSTLGFSANQMLAGTTTPRKTTLLWQNSDGLVLTGTSEQQVPLTVSFEPNLASSRAVVGKDGPCMDHMLVDGTLVLVTEDGTLNERITAQVEAFDLAVSTVSAGMGPGDLRGSLRVTSNSGPQPSELQFSVQYWSSEWKGKVTAVTATSASTRSMATIASW